MTRSEQTPAEARRSSPTALDVVRAIVLLAALASFAIWGFTTAETPLSLVYGIGAPVLALLVWALFLSPRPVMRVHPFIRAVAELLIYAAITMCWWDMGQVWIGLGFAVVAVAVGLTAGLRGLR